MTIFHRLFKASRVPLLALGALSAGSSNARAGIMEPYDTFLDNIPKGACKRGNPDHARLVCGLTHIQGVCSRWASDLTGCNGAVETAARAAAAACVNASGVDKAIWAAHKAYNAAYGAWMKVPSEREKRACGGAVSGASKTTSSCFQKTGSPSTWGTQLAGLMKTLRDQVNAFACPPGTALKGPERAKVDAALATARAKLNEAESRLAKQWYDAAESSACITQYQLDFAKRLCLERKVVNAKEDCEKIGRSLLDTQRKLALSTKALFEKQQEIWLKARECYGDREIIKYQVPEVAPCFAKINAAAQVRDCAKLKGITEQVNTCLEPARKVIAHNTSLLKSLAENPNTAKACSDMISKRVTTELLDDMFGSCEKFYSFLSSKISCDALADWVLKFIPKDSLLGSCAKGAVKGVVCGIPNLAMFVSELACGTVEKVLEGPCKYAGPLAPLCAAGHFIGQKFAKTGSCIKALHALRGVLGTINALKYAAAEITCDFIAGLAFGAAAEAGKLGSFVQKINHTLEGFLKSSGTVVKKVAEWSDRVNGAVGKVGEACHVAVSHGRPVGPVDTFRKVKASEPPGTGATPKATKKTPPRVRIKFPGVKPRAKTQSKPGSVAQTGNACAAFKAGTPGHAKKAGLPYRSVASWDPKTVVGKMDACATLKMARIRQAKGGGAFVEFEYQGETRYMHCLDLVRGEATCAN